MTLRPLARAAAAGLAALTAGFGAAAAAAAGFEQVSQRSRTFQPASVQVARGEAVRILNDDGELLHHAYVRADRFSFDSGEQEPGTAVEIRFPAAGTYTVLCAIHPRMRLTVTVR